MKHNFILYGALIVSGSEASGAPVRKVIGKAAVRLSVRKVVGKIAVRFAARLSAEAAVMVAAETAVTAVHSAHSSHAARRV